jgi:peptidyl-prolyl cis-trans isomerase SDCCAG10
MASVYSTEPPTSGKVIIKTNYGNIDIELWTKETPKACRNFIQLCLEEYYNNIIFHRIIKGFMIQTGDPSGKGNGGESIWNKDFPDEYHSRLKFSRRGIVAMANKNKPNTNGSQFFITMDKAPWLDKKHTIFGKITGDTIFNAININQLPTENDYPIDDIVPKILSTEVIINPFLDIIPRENKIMKNNERDSNNNNNNLINNKKELNNKKFEKLCNNNLISFEDDYNNDNNNDINEIKLIKDKKFGIKPFPGLKEDKQIKINKTNNNNNMINNNKEIKLNNINKIKNENKINYELTIEDSFIDNEGYNEDKLLKYLQLKTSEKENLIKTKEDIEIDNNNNNLNKNLSSSSNDSMSESDSFPDEDNNEKKNETNLNSDFDLDNDRKQEMKKIKNDIELIKKRIQKNSEGIKEIEIEKYTPLQEMRMKYLKNKVKRNLKDNIQKMEKFANNLKSLSKEEGNWMSNKLKFHTDSQKAFSMNETKEKVLRNFDFNNS